MDKLNVAILGSTGYTGIELLKILDLHPGVVIKFIGSNSLNKAKAKNLFSGLKNYSDLVIKHNSQISSTKNIHLVFSCLPHGELSKNYKKYKFNKNIMVIDLSADFRLPANLNKKWYRGNRDINVYKNFQYILPELNSKELDKNKNIANPGCYATSIALALAPICTLINNEVIIDTKSGVSGAGKSSKLEHIFNEANENLSLYNVGDHRHTPEIQNLLKKNYKISLNIDMVPHLLPITRGILSNIYINFKVTQSENKIRKYFKEFYKNKKFIKILNNDLPSIKDVVNTNNCIIGLKKLPNSKNFIITSVVDNLIKGASGQAVQNMNLLLGVPEDLGL